jgi:hypothetical protein
MKLLVNTPTGEQQVIEVGEGGGYFNESLIIWDERTDGPLPAITLGGMVRNGTSLAFNQAQKDSHDAAISAQIDPKLTGVFILGVMCSATKEDQMGLTAVGLDYSMTTAAGGTFADTEFNFQNGTTLVITSENFSSIYEVWVPFRRGFFAVA